jgi:hypothetical protein
MRTEFTLFEQPPVNRPTRPLLPFIVRHLAVCKPNRLAGSIRIPVTPANRVLLRELRAAELAAWEKSFGGDERLSSQLTGGAQ